MTTSVRLCLSYNILNRILLPLKSTVVEQKMLSCHGCRYDVICSHQSVM